MSPTQALGWIAIAVLTSGFGLLTFLLFSSPPAEAPRFGLRGLKRERALRERGLLRSIDPSLRVTAGLISRLPIAVTRAKIELLLTKAGDPLGLTPDEHLALSLFVGLGFGLLGWFLQEPLGLPPPTPIFALALGLATPHFRLTGGIEHRIRQVNRALPTAIDLAALCMGAGLDFPGAIRLLVDRALPPGEPLHEEFVRMLQVLELGQTRREALQRFAARVPSDAVQEFVSTVTQAEEKGNPLSTVLKSQAEVLRHRRSAAAETAAARAGVMMMLPLMLIFASIILILLGPFVLQGMGTGF